MIEDVRYREIAGGGLILAAAAVVMSLLSYSTADIILAGEGKPCVNMLGPAGVYFAHALRTAFGYAAFCVPVLMCLVGWHLFRHGTIEKGVEKLLALVLFTLSCSGLIALSWTSTLVQLGGGMAGLFISGLLDRIMGIAGAYLSLSALLLGSMILLGVLSLKTVAQSSLKKGETMTALMKKWIEKVTVRDGSERVPWITKETVFLYDETAEKPAAESFASPELRLVDIPVPMLGKENRPAELHVPRASIADQIRYIPSSRPAVSDDEDLDYIENDARSMDEIFTDEGQKALFEMRSDYKVPIPPEGVTSHRLTSIEKETVVATAVPVERDEELEDIEVEPAQPVQQVVSQPAFASIEEPLSDEDFCEENESAIEETMEAVVEGVEETVDGKDEVPVAAAAPTPARPAPKAAVKAVVEEEVEPEEEQPKQKVFDEIPINEEYIIPMSYLHVSPKHDRDSWESEIRKNSELLVKTLKDFSIEAKVSMVNRGPVVTLYEMQLAPGVKVTRVVSLSDDIAMALAASRVRVVAPIPGKSAIGIEVPNQRREMVTLGDIIITPEYHATDMMLKVIMGKDILGKPVMIDIKKQPHLLIAGATGAGKSVCVNGVIASLVCKYDPNHLRFIMIDPKMVELQLYNGLPHLLTPVITDPDETPKALKWAIFEMERRYKLLSEQCVRDIDRYNQKIASYRHPEEFEHLPYIVIIIDEFADLMMVAPKEMENYVTRIAQKARAVGIHVVLATQRPSVDIITGIIKANFPARVAFQVAQKIDSRTIIDQNGAEKLLGKGDMLYQSPTSSYPVRIQGAYISEDEILQIVQKACSFGRPRYIDFDEFIKEQNAAEDAEMEDAERDEMFVEALRIVEETKKASASYLQRRLSIGYNRAARIIEKMEELGYVGPQQGSKPRDVYV